MLNRVHKFTFVVILEPFKHIRHINSIEEGYRYHKYSTIIMGKYGDFLIMVSMLQLRVILNSNYLS